MSASLKALAKAEGVGSVHGGLLALEVFHAAERMDDVEHIGHALGRRNPRTRDHAKVIRSNKMR